MNCLVLGGGHPDRTNRGGLSIRGQHYPAKLGEQKLVPAECPCKLLLNIVESWIQQGLAFNDRPLCCALATLPIDQYCT